jgi:hypothetical protein
LKGKIAVQGATDNSNKFQDIDGNNVEVNKTKVKIAGNNTMDNSLEKTNIFYNGKKLGSNG